MEKLSSKQKYTLILLISVLAVYFFMRFFFTITLPFLLAFLVVWKAYPRLSKIRQKTKIKETWSMGLIIFLFLFIIVTALYIPLSNEMENVTLLEEDESFLESELVENCVEKYNEIKEVCSEYVGDDMVIKIQSGAFDTVKSCVSFFTYIIIFFVSLLLFCKDYMDIKKVIEDKSDNAIVQVAKGVISYIKAFLKSQVIIFVILALLCGVVLSVMGIENGWLYGILAGVLDAFPFVGTGIVLVPLCIWLFLKGEVFKAIICLVLYGVCALVRELLEPKLIGDKVGIYPIVLFASVFVGMQIFGVGGIIKGPLSVVIIYELRKVLLAKIK